MDPTSIPALLIHQESLSSHASWGLCSISSEVVVLLAGCSSTSFSVLSLEDNMVPSPTSS